MNVRIMNSLMMPVPGLVYVPEQVDVKRFADILRRALEDAAVAPNAVKIHSYVGYPQTARVIERVADLPEGTIEVNRSLATAEPGDVLLVAKLSYRVNPRDKGKEVDENDFEFYVVSVYGRDDVKFT